MGRGGQRGNPDDHLMPLPKRRMRQKTNPGVPRPVKQSTIELRARRYGMSAGCFKRMVAFALPPVLFNILHYLVNLDGIQHEDETGS